MPSHSLQSLVFGFSTRPHLSPNSYIIMREPAEMTPRMPPPSTTRPSFAPSERAPGRLPALARRHASWIAGCVSCR